jgi:poly-gamma-glutamate biosynthesis protein PgsC/CapC
VVELAIVLGIVINLLLTELVGFTAAGLVVPGYLALHLTQPVRLLATFAVALATWTVVRYGWMRLAILYGRRRTGVTVLTGILLNAATDYAVPSIIPMGTELRVIGYIVPGLIAGEALSQGIWPTLWMTLLVAALVRLLLMAAMAFGM